MRDMKEIQRHIAGTAAHGSEYVTHMSKRIRSASFAMKEASSYLLRRYTTKFRSLMAEQTPGRISSLSAVHAMRGSIPSTGVRSSGEHFHNPGHAGRSLIRRPAYGYFIGRLRDCLAASGRGRVLCESETIKCELPLECSPKSEIE